MRISIDDRKWLSENYPDLEFGFEGGKEIIIGVFKFSVSFDGKNKIYILNPSEHNRIDFRYIEDSYKVKIIFTTDDYTFPVVKELDGRIIKTAQKLDMQLIDLHAYGDGKCCLIGPYHESENLSFVEFINGPVLQFFFDQSYYEKFKVWPRGVYSHGYLGLIENYYESYSAGITGLEEKCITKLKQDSSVWNKVEKYLSNKTTIKGHWKCVCGSEKRFRECHIDVLKGLLLLQGYLKENSVN